MRKSQPTPKKSQPTPKTTVKKVTQKVTVKKPNQIKNVAPDRPLNTNKKYVPSYYIPKADRT